jgi:lysophospholipase L1-like esterase
MAAQTYTLLALGDSYTIGEGVALYETFTYQAIQLLRKAGHNFNAPEIIARTGWTTDDLKKGIRNTMFQASYNFVTLLIGVNDQYQNKNMNDYATNFEKILKQSIVFAGNDPSHVFVFSIPDWGQTPYADGRERSQVTIEINAFNEVNKTITLQHKAQYFSLMGDMTALSETLSLLAADQLHPSKKEYARWASQLSDEIQKLLI